MQLACDQQRARAVGLPQVVLSETGVPALVSLRHIEDLQAPVQPDEHSEGAE